MRQKDWSYSCWCGSTFAQVLEVAAHIAVHPMKCSRCKEWFHTLEDYLAHECRRLPHDH